MLIYIFLPFYIKAPPKAPRLDVVAITSSTIQVNWRSGSNGGSPILGKSRGLHLFSEPIMPAQSLLLKSINVTHVDLNMSSWQLSGCPIERFSIKYQVWNDESWTQVANNVNRNTTIFTVLDLHPATWYKMIVTAHSDAGNTECHLKFATLTYHGNDDGNINPYATFNELKEVFAETNELGRNTQMSDEFDEISLEKAQAQKAMLTPPEAYVPFFQTKGDKSEVLKDSIPLDVSHESQSRLQGYDNQERFYCNLLFFYDLSTGSQRHSLISSVTTVSSSRDELLEALENAKRNPPPPVVYESPPESSSQPTDSSGTEPGIVQFTQSPPKPNEQREAACELPAYNEAQGICGSASSSHSTMLVLVTSVRMISSSVRFSLVTRLLTLDGEGYGDLILVGGRRTPHGRARYSTSLQTPGTDESRPLVRSIVQQTMASPAEEDEDSVSLLDR
ncbi:hypothetical protein KUTeg_006359 [Tegillarca granosa]|uniref:Fibronectin type-III domain-containing protein n=1 Tax=Tegillarca granosa TaxID=220873 RepID=A0ABQ9FJ87_TEGGR|nr:hypothetical protein KUTeg_006359 [Tegillarca granosa]